MAYWLLKTEPSVFSYSDLERRKRAVWDGVNNHLALIHLRAMRSGDQALIYHSGWEKSVVGLAEIVTDAYPDPKKRDPKLVVVDLVPRQRLLRPVSLEVIKGLKEFGAFELVRMPRLSVMPVPVPLWKKLLTLAH